MSEFPNFLGDVEGFIGRLIRSLEQDKIDVSNLHLDHICYRVETKKQYLDYQKKLSKLGKLLSETSIGGRMISSYKLSNPLRVLNREIYVVELPAPKKGRPYQQGLEHAEFVIEDSFEEFMRKHSNLNFDTGGILKQINPDVAIKYETFTVKFHHNSLERVIKHEQQVSAY